MDALANSLQESSKLKIFTQKQACEWIAGKLRIKTKKWGPDNLTLEEKGWGEKKGVVDGRIDGVVFIFLHGPFFF